MPQTKACVSKLASSWLATPASMLQQSSKARPDPHGHWCPASWTQQSMSRLPLSQTHGPPVPSGAGCRRPSPGTPSPASPNVRRRSVVDEPRSIVVSSTSPPTTHLSPEAIGASARSRRTERASASHASVLPGAGFSPVGACPRAVTSSPLSRKWRRNRSERHVLQVPGEDVVAGVAAVAVNISPSLTELRAAVSALRGATLDLQAAKR